MAKKYRYKITEVEAVQLSHFETDRTVEVSYWMLEKIADPKTANHPKTDWMVKRPDGSVVFCSDQQFREEFEEIPSALEDKNTPTGV